MNHNFPTVTDDTKNEIEKRVFDLFSGIAMNRRLFGMSREQAVTVAIDMVNSFISGRRKSYPTNPAVLHMKEFAQTRLAQFARHEKNNDNDDMANASDEVATRRTNEGVFELNRQIRLMIQKAPTAPMLPYQTALKDRREKQRKTA